MEKKKSLNLSALKVKSFVTQGNALNQNTVKGGTGVPLVTFIGPPCETLEATCGLCITEPYCA